MIAMNPHSRYPLYFAVPAVVLYGLFFIVPSLGGIVYAFTDWSSFSDEVNFVGLKNFAKLFSPGEHYLGYFWNTFLFTAVTIVLKTVIGLGLALLLNEGIRRFVNVYRVMIYVPVVLPMLVVGLMFRSILNPATGLLNTFLRAIGLDVLTQSWLVDPHIALYSLMVVDTWKGVGYIMVILLAGLQTIPRDYLEAAEVDGANAWQRFWHVTLPLLMPAVVIVTVLNVLYGLRIFDIIYATTHGGPGFATEVIQTGIFSLFSDGRYGLGTALSTVLFFILLAAGYGVIRLLEQKPVGQS
jgi:raffinose/stachyose/melibiose transport system permease protein